MMTYLSSIRYNFFYIDQMEERSYLGSCKEAKFDEYLDELLDNGYLVAELTWDRELVEEEFPD